MVLSAAVSDHLVDVLLMKKKRSFRVIMTGDNDRCFKDTSEGRALITWCNWFLNSKGLEIKHLGELEDGTFFITILEELTGLKSYDAHCVRSSTTSVGLRQRNWATILDILGLDESSVHGEFVKIFTQI